MLKKCALERVRDESLFTGKISVNEVQRTFPPVRSRMILFLNDFLKRLDTNSDSFKFKRAFSKAGTAERNDGFFIETDFQDMLKAREFVHLENLSPFLGTFMETFWG